METERTIGNKPIVIPLFTFKLEEDGITHINIYSNGKSPLGRFLSHFAPVAVHHPVHGDFPSLENFYQFVKTGCNEPIFKTLAPHLAKLKARQYLDKRPIDFDDLIRDMNERKINGNIKAKMAFINSILPFDHYYVMTDKRTGSIFKVRPREADKFVIMFESLRIKLRKIYDDAEASLANISSGSIGRAESS